MLTIEIETGNAAFEDAPSCEVARILRELAARIEREMPVPKHALDVGAWALRDVNGNGNRVGYVQFG